MVKTFFWQVFIVRSSCKPTPLVSTLLPSKLKAINAKLVNILTLVVEGTQNCLIVVK